MTTSTRRKMVATKTKTKKAPAKKTLITKPAPVAKLELPVLPASPPVTASVFERGFLFKFTMGVPSFRAKVDKTKIDAGDADKALLSVGMKLIECEEYDQILGIYSSIKKYLALKAIPTSLRESYYLIH